MNFPLDTRDIGIQFTSCVQGDATFNQLLQKIQDHGWNGIVARKELMKHCWDIIFQHIDAKYEPYRYRFDKILEVAVLDASPDRASVMRNVERIKLIREGYYALPGENRISRQTWRNWEEIAKYWVAIEAYRPTTSADAKRVVQATKSGKVLQPKHCIDEEFPEMERRVREDSGTTFGDRKRLATSGRPTSLETIKKKMRSLAELCISHDLTEEKMIELLRAEYHFA